MELDISDPSDLAPNEGCPGQAKIDICDSGPKSSHIENYRSLVTWHHDITDHFIQCMVFLQYVDGFQAIWLTLQQDPRAGKARATLDREVNCHFFLSGPPWKTKISKVSSLEPYLEALPSLLAMIYLKSVDPGFFSSSWSQVSLIKSCLTICQIRYCQSNQGLWHHPSEDFH